MLGFSFRPLSLVHTCSRSGDGNGSGGGSVKNLRPSVSKHDGNKSGRLVSIPKAKFCCLISSLMD